MASTLFASTGISSDNSSASASENPRWTNDKGSRLANLMVSWGNQMNQPGYQEITKEASTIPIHWGSDRDQVVDATYAAMGIAVLSTLLFQYMSVGRVRPFTVISSP